MQGIVFLPYNLLFRLYKHCLGSQFVCILKWMKFEASRYTGAIESGGGVWGNFGVL